MKRLRVRTNPWLASPYFVAAGLAIVDLGLTGNGLAAFFAVLMIAVALRYLLGTVLVATDGAVELINGFGGVSRRYKVASPHDLDVRGRTLTIRSRDGRPAKVTGILARGSDWRALATAIERARAATPEAARAAT
jgi:hypothetical protein